MPDHHVEAGVETAHWGWFEAALPPVLTVKNGATVRLDTVSGGPEVLPPEGFRVPDALREIHAGAERMLPGHILTGPVAVEGAEPGDVLQVEILDIRVTQDWGFNFIRPLSGTLPDDFPDPHLTHIALDAERGVGRLPWGLDLPLAPFFGVMGVAPPPVWQRVSSIQPRSHGGNIDLKELVAGTTLYLPVWTEGALFSCGDGHGAQGDGEVNVTAIETALSGDFRLTARKDLAFRHPRAETPTHWITLGFDPDLDQCAVRALRDMIDLIGAHAGLSREEAYTLCSLAADLRITQTVNGNKGVHCMIAKDLIGG